MQNILLNNGQSVIIGPNKDIIEAVQEHCSHELASLINGEFEKIEEFDKEQIYQEARADTDADSYLSDLGSRECCLRDILEAAEELTDYIEDSKRLNKDKLWSMVQKIVTTINNEI